MACKKGTLIIWITYFLVMLGLLTSCGKEAPEADPASVWNNIRYTAEHTPLGIYRLEPATAIQGDTIYFSAYLTRKDGTASLCIIDKSGGDIRQLTGYKQYTLPLLTLEQEAGTEAANRYAYCALQVYPTEKCLWIAAYRLLQESDNADEPPALLLLQIDPTDGKVTQDIVLCEKGYDDTQVSLCCDSQGNVYASFGRGIYAYNAEGQALGQLSAFEGRLLALPSGSAAFLSDSEDGTQWRLREIDPKTHAFCKETPVNAVAQDAFRNITTKIYSGTSEYAFLYDDGESLYGYHMDRSQESYAGEHLLTWINCDLEGSGIVAVAETEEGFTCVATDETFGCEIVQLRPRQPSERDPVIITLAGHDLTEFVTQAVLRFNRQNTDIRIEVRDYGVFAARNGLAAGLDRFTTDLITGNAADLFYTSNLDEQMLIDRGILEDLWPWIDGDEILGGREGVVQPLFEAMSQDGKLYTITDFFFIRTTVGYEDMVEGHEGWSVDELLETYQSKENCHSILRPDRSNRETELERMISMCAESFIDRQNWTASFDSPEFVKQLEYLSFIPEGSMEKDCCENWLVNREQLMESRSIVQISQMLTMFFDDSATDTLVGYPGVQGNGAAFDVMTKMGMWAGSQHKEEAWAFLRFVLSLENQRNMIRVSENSRAKYTSIWGIPSNRATCDLIIQGMSAEGIWRRTNGKEETIYWTQADTDRFWNYVESVKVVERTEESIAAIIRDEATRFFTGDQTAQAAAKAIQSRVKLYLGERK